jgi:MFS family permease
MIPDKQNRSGGLYYGWIVVGVIFLIGFTEAGVFQNILSIFMKPMAREFGWSRSIITGAIAVGSLGGGILSPFIGPVLDRYGPRKAAFYGVLILSLGLVSLSLLSRVWQLYLFFGTGRMIAMGVLNLVIAVSVSNWFIKKRGRAMGIAQLGSRLGAAVFPPFVQFLIFLVGWRPAWAGLGVVVFLMSAVPALLFLKRRPEDIGLWPDGDRPIPERSDLISETADGTVFGKPGQESPLTRKQVLKQPVFWLLVMVSSFLVFGGAGINFHLYPFLTDRGVSAGTAVFILSVIAVSGGVGGLLLGLLTEKYQAKKVLAIALAVLGILLCSIFWAIRNEAVLFVFALFFGLLRGGMLPLIPLVWAEVYGRESLGTVLSLSGPVRLTANALGPVFGGLCFDMLGDYVVPFLIFSSLFLMAGVLSYLAPEKSDRG